MPPYDSNSDTITRIFINESIFNRTDSITIDKKIIRALQEEISLAWILFGSFGNLLSFIILCSKKMRIHSTFTYLMLLSIADCFVLYFGQLRDYLVNKYQINVEGEIWCKFHVFLFYFMLHMASWLLVAVNVDRFISATFLALSKKFCTPQTALKVSAGVAVCLSLLNLHFIYFVESSASISHLTNEISTLQDKVSDVEFNIPKNTTETVKSNADNIAFEVPINPYVYQKCIIKANSPRYAYFFQKIFVWIDASAQVILPFLIMVFCNIVIIYKVLLNKNKSNGKNLKRLRKIKGMCIMIVSVSVIFFVLEAPVLIFICFGIEQSEWAHTELLWTIINLMMYTNHVINFISYCMTGEKFRREMLRLLNIHNAVKKLNIFFTKIPEPTNTRCNNYITQTRPMHSNYDIEMKDFSNKLQDTTLKITSLSTRIMDKKNKLLTLEVNTAKDCQNKTIRNLVINKIELKHLKVNSSDESESCSSISHSIYNSQPLLNRFNYNSHNISSTYLTRTVNDLDKIKSERRDINNN